MREIAVVISDLYLPRAADAPPTNVAPLPGLAEAARFGQRLAVEGSWRAWLARWMGRDDLARAAPAAVAAASAARACGEGSVWIANPIHLIAGLTSLHLDYQGLLRLPAQDLTRLAEDFANTFGEAEFHLEALESGPFLLRTSRTLDALTTEPSRVLARELQTSLPNGPDAPILKRLGAELEMWLHSHPVNEARGRRGELPISTLWPWGGGAALQFKEGEAALQHKGGKAALQSQSGEAALEERGVATPATSHDARSGPIAFGSDPFLAGLSYLTALDLRSLPERLPDPDDWPHTQRAVIVAQITTLLQANPGWTMFEALAHLDRCFILPAMEALRSGAVSRVLIMANDIRLQIERRDRLRFWRRRPKAGSAALRALME